MRDQSRPAILVSDFHKTFHIGLRRRSFAAARGISFEVAAGEIFGFLGPNGAGKTTTIKALLGLIRPDAGRLELLGLPVSDRGWRARVGYLPEHPQFYEYLTAFELVTWFAQLSGYTRHEAEKEAQRQLARVKLAAAMTRRLRSYSKGMLQRAGLAQAMVGSPDVLILDEPMTGLDPIGRRDVREILLELKSEHKTVLYSTHILPDVELTCDRVAIVHQGRTRKVVSLMEMLAEATQGVALRLRNVSSDRAQALAQRWPRVRVTDDWVQLDLESSDEARRVLAEESALGATLDGFQPHREDLETLFVRTLADDAKPGSEASP